MSKKDRFNSRTFASFVRAWSVRKRTRSSNGEAGERRRGLGFCATAIFLSLFSVSLSCSRPKNVDSPTEERTVRRSLVQTTRARAYEVDDALRFSGTAKEGQTIKASFRVSGPLTELRAEVGKRVEKGELLAKIDPRDFELAVRQAEEDLNEANATFQAMKTGARAEDVAALEAALAAAQAQFETAKKNEERFARLLEKQSVTQLKYDEMKLTFEQASAALEGARQNLTKAKTGARAEDVAAMEAKIAGLTAKLDKARNALSDVSLFAPSDGYVSQKYVENGEIVAPGIPILAFTDASEIKVRTSIPESTLVRRDEFVGFECEFEAYPGRKFPATLRELGLAQQAGKQGYPLEVSLESDGTTTICPGMAATVTIRLNKATDELLVPLSALVGDEEIATAVSENGERRSASARSEKTFVWRVDPESDRLVKRNVVVRRVVDEGAIVVGDLTPGERVVSAGARFIRENEKVRVK